MTTHTTEHFEQDFAAFIGIDWADTKHDICLQAAESKQREFTVLPHRPKDIDEWAGSLRRRFHSRQVAICIETSRSALVYALQKYDFIVLFPINPATLAKYRQAFKPSRAKDDPTDAQIALEILLGHRDKLKALQPQSPPAVRELAMLLEELAVVACFPQTSRSTVLTRTVCSMSCNLVYEYLPNGPERLK